MFEVTALPIFKDNYVWIIRWESQVWVVDPGDGKAVSDYLEARGLFLAGILITHHHSDHTGGLAHLIDRYQPMIIGAINSKILTLTRRVCEPDSIQLSSEVCLEVLSVPGHTCDHLAYYSQSISSVFCGDTLFSGGCGRLFEGDMKGLYASLQKLNRLPETTKIYCAHEYTLNNLAFAIEVEPDNEQTRHRIAFVRHLRARNEPSLPSLLSEERETNPFLRCHLPNVIARVEAEAGKRLRTTLEVFTALREWKDAWP